MIDNKIRVLIADDHDLIRLGLKKIVETNKSIVVIGEASTGEETIDFIKLHKPDVILMDANMPNLNGLEVLKILKEEKISIKTLIITIEDNISIIKKFINAGADGYILKGSPSGELIIAIERVSAGEKYIDKSIVPLIFDDMSGKTNAANIMNKLSKREIQTLYHISKGLSNKEIADKLFLSESTVKNYVTELLKVLEVKNRVNATVLAIENDVEKYYNEIEE